LKRIVSLRTELQPAFLTHSGYGIPQEEDLKDFSEIKAKINELNQLTEKLQILTKGLFPNQETEIKNIENNIELFKKAVMAR
ncbi:MAG: hypothetical protein ACXVCR_12740, partial [Bdellovibrio sp.]